MITSWGGYSLAPQAAIQIGPQLQQLLHHEPQQGPHQRQALPHTQPQQLRAPTHPHHIPQLSAQPTPPTQPLGSHSHPKHNTDHSSHRLSADPTTAFLGFGTARYAQPYDPATDPWRTASDSPPR